MKNIILALLTLFISITTVQASDNAGAFLETGTGARAIALGYSGVAMLDNTDAIYWNPANLIHATTTAQPHGSTSLTAFNAYETNYVSLQLTSQIQNLPIGIAYIYAGIDGVAESNSTNNRVDRYETNGVLFGSFQHALLISSAFNLSPDLALGITGKAIYETLHSNSAWGFGADVGLNYAMSSQLTFAINIQNAIKPTIKWDTESKNADSIPMNYKVGLGYNNTTKTLLTTFDANLRNNRPTKYSLGTEIKPIKTLALRIGYQTDAEKIKDTNLTNFLQNVSLGFGLDLSPLQIDFSWTNPELDIQDDIYRVSVGFDVRPW